MIFVSSPGRTATTSISNWLKKNTDVCVLQEPTLGKIIYMLNNLRNRKSFPSIVEEFFSFLLCMQLRYIKNRNDKFVYVDPFTSHSKIFRKKLQSSIEDLHILQLTRERRSWAKSLVKFESHGILKFLKPYMPFSSPIARSSVDTRFEQYLYEFDYRISAQTNFKFDLILDYEHLISDQGLDNLKTFFVGVGYLTPKCAPIVLNKENSSH